MIFKVAVVVFQDCYGTPSWKCVAFCHAVSRTPPDCNASIVTTDQTTYGSLKGGYNFVRPVQQKLKCTEFVMYFIIHTIANLQDQ